MGPVARADWATIAGGGGQVSEKPLENEAFSCFCQAGRGGLASSWAIGVAPDVKDEKTVPTEAVGIILAGGREGKMEIAAK